MTRTISPETLFIFAFVRSHGSIKEMERIFGVSYPTVKNRLNRIGEGFELVEADAATPHSEALTQLERGEITFEEAIGRISE